MTRDEKEWLARLERNRERLDRELRRMRWLLVGAELLVLVILGLGLWLWLYP